MTIKAKSAGKYCKKPSKSVNGLLRGSAVVLTILLLAAVCFLIFYTTAEGSIYQQLCRDGYRGTQEQWLASLVGEAVDENAAAAYELALDCGYRGSRQQWVETITGHTDTDLSKSVYRIACEHGYEGSLTQWLSAIAEAPEKLGRSDKSGQQTEYERACEYGYTGTFPEWIVFMVYGQESNGN